MGFKLRRWQINYFRLTFWVDAENVALNVIEYFQFPSRNLRTSTARGERGGGGVRGHSRLLTF